jgi:hypothetical protein
MVTKSQTRNLITAFIHLVETQFDSKVKCLHSDNGIEFQMLAFYQSKGIIHQLSCVETPQQNSIVERKHQHLLNVARALQFQANLPLYLWGECVLSTAHIINRIPTPTLSNKTPYECLFSTPPSFSHLRVIGCFCFVSTLSRNRSKFDHHAKPYVLVGYPYNIKGYKLFDLSSHTLIVSRDVIFHEDVFPYHAHFKSSYPQYHNLVLPNPISDCADIDIVHPTSSSPNSNFPEPTSISSPSTNIVPAPDSNTHNVQPICKSSRVKHKPSYLHQFHCQMATASHFSPVSSTVSGIPHSLSNVLSYDKLSPSHQYFFFSISTSIES